ncbi:MAG: RDD family protein [Deltaproteobacteria bacterium]|nr:MAG: RDD family protein [Deltaproteobacteria bacterium]
MGDLVPSYSFSPSSRKAEQKASFGARIGAFVIDSFIGSFGALVVTGFMSAATQNEFVLAMSWLASHLGYHAGFISSLGATPGKAIAGLEVVDADTGKRISFRRALLRTMSYFVSMSFSYLGFLWAMWDKNQQAWHDKIANTMVISRIPPQLPPPLPYQSLSSPATRSYARLEKRILELARKRGGRLTVVEVAMETDLILDEAKAFLERLVDRGYVEIEVSPSGMIVYRFFDLVHEGEKDQARAPLEGEDPPLLPSLSSE